ncbi:hypothetical protein BD560DRAFT_413533 [Blakeslea trispora]|nr:hypothetical protein BD560DRAFT_413533 [Blakeslea trispora]
MSNASSPPPTMDPASKSESPKLKTIRSRSPSPTTKKTVIESRRAEQNRAAQRAFRQRKERYVKELEARVNAMADWPARMEALEMENERLKRKIQALEDEHGCSNQRKSLKLEYINNNHESNTYTTASKPLPRMCTPTSNTSQQHTTSSPPSTSIQQGNKTVVGEKGRVLDDLVSILRTRHRPPIQPN